jgi:hypothetical protein
MRYLGLLIVAGVLLAGCSEVQQYNKRFTATGYSMNLFFLQIPKDPKVLAAERVPSGSTVTNVNSAAQDWHSLPGFLNRLLGMGITQIGGTTTDKTTKP